MLERATSRALPLVNRASEYAPVIPACCNVCRTCTTTSLVGFAMGAVVAAGAFASRLFGRLRPGVRDAR